MPLRLPPLVRISLCALGLVFALAVVDATVLGAPGVSARLHHKGFGNEAADFFANDTNRLVISVFVYPFALLCLIACRHIADQRSFASLGFAATAHLS